MRRFAFKLERLLKLREHAEKDWENRLGEITSRCNVCRRRIAGKEADHSRILEARSRGTGVTDLTAAELFMRRMREEIRSLNGELAGLEKTREEIQARYLEASRERKILQKLKERQEQEYMKEQVKEEAKILDDINNSAAARGQAVFPEA